MSCANLAACYSLDHVDHGKIAFVSLGLLGLIVVAFCIYSVFRHGKQSRFLSDINLTRNGMSVLAIVLIQNTFQWLRGEPFWLSLWEALPAIAAMCVILAGIWLVGFFFGRARDHNDDAIIGQ